MPQFEFDYTPSPSPSTNNPDYDTVVLEPISLEDLYDVVIVQAAVADLMANDANKIAAALSPQEIGQPMPDGLQEALGAVLAAFADLQFELDAWFDDLADQVAEQA